jgi:hypothetical protein
MLKAVHFWTLAADQRYGHAHALTADQGIAEAQYYFTIFPSGGRSNSIDLQLAAQYCKRTPDQGYALAQ